MGEGSNKLPGLLAMLALSWLPSGPPAHGQTCTVPGSHGTIQAAIDDPGCSEIDLAAQIYAESTNIPRPLTISGPGGGGATIEGLVRVVGAGTVVNLTDLAVRNGCPENALLVLGGGEVTGSNLGVERGPTLPCPVSQIFADGFESGDTSAWSNSVP